MSENKLSQVITYSNLSFSVFEKSYNDKIIKNYNLRKTKFNKEENKSETVASISLDNFNDLSLIKKMLSSCISKDTHYMPYTIMRLPANNFSLIKAYKDKNNDDKQQNIELTPKEVFCMLDLIERVLAINIKPTSFKETTKASNKAEFIDTIQQDNSTPPDYITDSSIAIDDAIPF